MTAAPGTRERRDRVLGLVLLAGVALWLVQNHWQAVDIEKYEDKVVLHERVLENTARDPYQYKLWVITHAMEWVRQQTDVGLQGIFCANTLLALLLMMWAHHAWLRSLVDERAALFGGILLGALGNTLFLIYHHHPYEFWGVAGFCVLLRQIQRDAHWLLLTGLALVVGLVWEKHALLPALWGLWSLQRGRPFVSSFLKGLVFLAAALAVPLLVRWHVGTDRGHVDGDTPLHVQSWGKVIWFQLAYMVPFALMFVWRHRQLPPWLRWLWLYLPVLLVAYAVKSYILHEVRSFWALAPVFTATACVWWRTLEPREAPPSAPF